MAELAITVSIVGILGAVALPTFQDMRLKSKRSEANVNVEGIYTAIVAKKADSDDALIEPGGTWNYNPPWTWGSMGEQRQWDPGYSYWDDLGYRPDGDMRCSYFLVDYGGRYWYTGAACDLDDDFHEFALFYVSDGYQELGYSNPFSYDWNVY